MKPQEFAHLIDKLWRGMVRGPALIRMATSWRRELDAMDYLRPCEAIPRPTDRPPTIGDM
jgi:hypothetical protein